MDLELVAGCEVSSMTVPLSIRFWAGMHTVVSSRVFMLMVVEYRVFAIVDVE